MPYHDPAVPVKQRRAILQEDYGFECKCELCSWSLIHGLENETLIPEPSGDSLTLKRFNTSVRNFALPAKKMTSDWLSLTQKLFPQLPESLLPVFHPSYLPALSEAFSHSSHEGNIADALEIGRTLLALYRILYSPGFPLLGK
jgi:hypothetical protein